MYTYTTSLSLEGRRWSCWGIFISIEIMENHLDFQEVCVEKYGTVDVVEFLHHLAYNIYIYTEKPVNNGRTVNWHCISAINSGIWYWQICLCCSISTPKRCNMDIKTISVFALEIPVPKHNFFKDYVESKSLQTQCFCRCPTKINATEICPAKKALGQSVQRQPLETVGNRQGIWDSVSHPLSRGNLRGHRSNVWPKKRCSEERMVNWALLMNCCQICNRWHWWHFSSHSLKLWFRPM